MPIAELFRHSPKEVTCGFFAMAGHQALALILNGFAVSYMTNTLGMTKNDSLLVLMISLVCACICGLPLAALADRIGGWKIFMLGVAFAFVMAFPLFWLINTKNMLLAALGMSLIYGISWGCTAGAQGAFLSNLFQTRCRFSGIAMSRELSGAIIGGVTPFIATILVAASNGRPTLVSAYLMGFCALSMISIWAGKDLARHTG